MGDERKTRALGEQTTAAPGVTPERVEGVGVRAGMRVGAVVLEEQIGQGGMGVVWRGRHELLQREVAVKFLTEAVEEGDPGFAVFVEGARAAAAVKHPGLVQVFDAGVTSLAGGDGGTVSHEGAPSKPEDRLTRWHGGWRVPYLVMELVDGPGLDRVLRVCGAMSLAAALEVMGQVCEAVGELHAAGFVHRDIKPGNILLDADGKVHVTDFGLACERPRHVTTDVQSKGGGTIAGTPAYMAPETFVGEVSARSDVYGLAMMMYELLVGEPPFTGEFLAIKKAHEGEPVSRERLAARGVPEGVIDVIERGAVKSAMVRPRSAMHWLESLRVAGRGCEEGGAREVRGLVARVRGEAWERGAAEDSTSYYKTISERAEVKRKSGERGHVEAFESSAIREAHPPTPSPPSLREGERKQGLPCVGCGYDLVGIAEEEGKCPECGRAVKESVWAERLVFADAAWLRRVAGGLAMLQWGLGLMPVLMVVLALISLLVLRKSPEASMGRAIGLSVGFGLITSIVLFMIGVVGATAREPGKSGGAGRWLRWVWLVGIVLGAAGYVADAIEGKFPEQVLMLPALHLLLGGVVLFGAMVKGFGERIPDRKLVRAGKSVLAPWVVLVFVVMGMSVAKWIGVPTRFNEVQLLLMAWCVGLLYCALLAGLAARRVGAVAGIATERPAAQARKRKDAGRPRGPLWAEVALATLVFSGTVVPMFLTAPYFRRATYEVAELLGLLSKPPGMPNFEVFVEGKAFAGRPPVVFNIGSAVVMVSAIYALPVLLGFVVYLRRVLWRPRPDGVTRCGWCGYELLGLKEARCPECGVEIGGQPAGNAPVMTRKRWWRTMAVRTAGAWAVFPVLMGLLIMAVINPLRIPEPGATVNGVLVILGTHVPAFVVTLVVFHVAVRGVAGVRGRTWCGGCGREMGSGVCGCGRRVVEG